MKILFFYVHPAKFYLFTNTIKLLKDKGHEVDVVVSDKDVLVDLLESSGEKFHNLFPTGRKLRFLPVKLNMIIGLFRTLFKLWVFTRKKNYDVYITDDVLTILGRIQKVPSIVFTDNDIKTIRSIQLIFKSSDKIIAPTSTDLEEFSPKKISFKGNKALANLHPDYFKLSSHLFNKYNLSSKEYIIIRLAKLNANHDIHGNPGITDKDLRTLIDLIPSKYAIIINSERSIPSEFDKFKLNISPLDFHQLLANAKFFIGDSSTVATEAAVLGVPNILINNIAKELGVLIELKTKFELHEYFDDFNTSIPTIKKMFSNYNLMKEFQKKRDKMLKETDDFNQLLFETIIKLGENAKK